MTGEKKGERKNLFSALNPRLWLLLRKIKNRGRERAGFVEGVAHIAFRVDDVERASKILRERGVKFVEEKLDKGGKKKAYHFLDPDGLELEIYGKTREIIPTY